MTAMEMTKWFDTNYHYIVPELGPETSFSLSSTKPFDEHAEAMEELGIDTVPVIVGPVSFLLLGKSADGVPRTSTASACSSALLEVYGEVIERLAGQGPTWVQLDEPCFVEDRSERELDALRLAYEELAKVHERTRIVVKTYFDHVGDAYGVLRDLPIEGIGLDLHRGGPDLDRVMEREGPKNVELIARRGRARGQVAVRRASSTAATSGSTSSSTASTCSAGLRDRCARAGRLHLLLAAPHARRPRRRAAVRGARRRAALVDGLRAPEGRGGGDPRPRPRPGQGGDRRRARRERPRARGPAQLAPNPQPRRARPGRRRSTDDDATAPEPVRGRAARPSAPGSTCRCSRPRRSGRTRRRPRSARRAPSSAQGEIDRGGVRPPHASPRSSA